MSAWTNVTLDRSGEIHERRQQALLHAEMEFWKREAERLRDVLENIPEAVERWGYVDIIRRGEETITLVQKPEEASTTQDPDHAGGEAR